MDILDVFNADAFSWMNLTARINRMPFVPKRIARMGLFGEQGITTTIVAVEEIAGLLSLIPTSPRGGPGYEHQRNRAKLRYLTVPHVELNDSVYPDEVQNRRVFGGDGLAGAQSVIDQRFAQMAPKHDATLEYSRIGAVKGTILDADGSSVIYNLFTEFGVSQTVVDFTLGTAGTNELGNVLTVVAAIEDELGEDTYDHIHCFCGTTFFQRLSTHPSVAAAFNLWQNGAGQLGAFFREDLRYQGFPFGGVVFEQYRGKVGSLAFIPTSEAYFFPVGVNGLFQTYFAPADYMETVNTEGLPRYAKQAPDPEFNRYIRLNTQSNPLSLCTRPKVLVKGSTSN